MPLNTGVATDSSVPAGSPADVPVCPDKLRHYHNHIMTVWGGREQSSCAAASLGVVMVSWWLPPASTVKFCVVGTNLQSQIKPAKPASPGRSWWHSRSYLCNETLVALKDHSDGGHESSRDSRNYMYSIYIQIMFIKKTLFIAN